MMALAKSVAVREYEEFDARSLSHTPRVFSRCVAGQNMLFKPRRIRDSSREAVNRRQIHGLMDQDIGIPRKLDKIIGECRIPGDDDRPISGIEPVGEGGFYGRMANQCSRHLHVSVFEEGTGEFVAVHERHKRGLSLVCDADVDVVGVRAPVPADVASIPETIKDLEAAKKGLQEDLQQAVGSQKPPIVSQINKLNKQIKDLKNKLVAFNKPRCPIDRVICKGC